MYCKFCGNPNKDSAKFCARCGTALPAPLSTSPERLGEPRVVGYASTSSPASDKENAPVKPLAPLKRVKPGTSSGSSPETKSYTPSPDYAPKDYGIPPSGSAPGGYSAPPHDYAPRDYGTPPLDYAPRDYGTPPRDYAPRDYGTPPRDYAPRDYGTPPRDYAPRDYGTPPRDYTPRDYGTPPRDYTPRDYGTPPRDYAPRDYGAPPRDYAPRDYGYPHGYGAPPRSMYGPPPGMNRYNGARYTNITQVPVTPMFWIALFLTLVSFVGIFTPWIGIKISALGSSKTEKLSYSDIFNDKDEDGKIISSYLSKSQSKKVKLCKTCNKILKWGGLFGFILCGTSLVFAAAFRNYLSGINAVAFVCFLVVLIAAFIECSTIKGIMEDEFPTVFSVAKLKIYPFIGIYLPLVCSLIAAVCANADVRERRHLLGMNR
ncbi:MAG: zinc-ribbon domain-containing protein [Ruminococcus sp.]|nr:zinc-ribbon domain-containing protein [Ruminococcus sp.]